jgi:hypothetical protein
VTPEPMKVVPVRLRIQDVELLKSWAHVHGRDFSKEVRLAIELHLRELMLQHLSHEAGREDVRQQGLDPDEEFAMLTASLDRKRHEAYGPRDRTFTPSTAKEVAAS